MHTPSASPPGRFFRRHRMGLPSVLIVAALAAAGLGWTLDQSTDPPASEPGLARGCIVPSTDVPVLDPCTGFATEAPAALPTSAASLTCRQAWRDGAHHIIVWDDGNRLWLDWDLPSNADAGHPLASGWIVAWWGATPAVDHLLVFGGELKGTAAYPLPQLPDELLVHAGSIAVGGRLDDGLRAFSATPFAFTPSGDVRLAGSVNEGEITLEVPVSRSLEVKQGDESLSFVASPDYGTRLTGC